MSIDKTCQVNS